MCTCTSCKYTDSFAGWKYGKNGKRLQDHKVGGFGRWPCDEPKGPRKSAAEYVGHVAHGKAGLAAGWAFKPRATPHYPYTGAPGLPYPSKLVRDFIAAGYKKTGQAEAEPARPETPGKAPQHFPAPDRRREAATIYTMPKKTDSTPRGRPPIVGSKRVIVQIHERHIERLRELGGGGKQALSPGLRKLLVQSFG